MTEETKRHLIAKLAAGCISKEEYRSLELAALNDDFLFEALEGYANGNKDHSSSRGIIIEKTYKKIAPTIRKRLLPYISMAAACLLLVLGVNWLFESKVDNLQSNTQTKSIADNKYRTNINNKSDSIAKEQPLPKTKINQIAFKLKKEIKTNNSTTYKDKTNNSTPIKEKDILINNDGIAQNQPITPRKEIEKNNTGIPIRSTSSQEPINQSAIEEVMAHNAYLGSDDEDTLDTDLTFKKDVSNNMISGFVFDSNGIPLIGANIQLGDIGTITDFDGKFSLQKDTSIMIISISYTGYETKIVPILNQKSNYIVELDEGKNLDEIVVVDKSKYKDLTKKMYQDWSVFEHKLKIELSNNLLFGEDGENLKFTYSITISDKGKIKGVKITTLSYPSYEKEIVKSIKKFKGFIPKSAYKSTITREYTP